tara:strand:- start:945 stop:1265 length:321 start_codon:yes stop_codon:yes gene_type:complete
MSAKDRPLGEDTFSWDDAGEDIAPHLDGPVDARPEGTLLRPSEAVDRGLDGGRPSALGVDRRPEAVIECDILDHRDRIDRARRLGLFETEEALDSPSDLDPTWKRS